jgi:rRNA-processing protein FCF1
VISRLVIEELVRNIRSKAPRAVARLDLLFSVIEFEVTLDPQSSDVDRWAARGFGTDAPIVAAAVAADVDFLCTGDKRLRDRLRAHKDQNLAVSPAELVDHLT